MLCIWLSKNSWNLSYSEIHIDSVYQHKIELFCPKQEAAAIVEAAYNNYANAAQRSAMVQEFYGPSFSLFKVSILTL